jgi:hypothetical protein
MERTKSIIDWIGRFGEISVRWDGEGLGTFAGRGTQTSMLRSMRPRNRGTSPILLQNDTLISVP